MDVYDRATDPDHKLLLTLLLPLSAKTTGWEKVPRGCLLPHSDKGPAK